MAYGRVFVIIYSLVLIILFISFSYLITTIDPQIKSQTDGDVNKSTSTKETTTTTEPSSETTTITSTTEDVSSSETTTEEAVRGGIHPRASTNKFKHPVTIRGHRRKEDIIDRITQTTPGDTIVQLPSTPEINVSQYIISPATHNVLVAETSSEAKGEPIKHDLNELGDKIQRILPPVHPAVKGFRRSVDDVGYRLSDKNVILLKIVDDEGVPRIEIKLRATNGHSKQRNGSEIKLKNKTEHEKLNFYIQVDSETALKDLSVEPSHSSNDIYYDYEDSETTIETNYVQSKATLNTNVLPLKVHNSLLTSDSDASTISYNDTTYTIHQKSNIDSTRLVNTSTTLANGETDANETTTIKSFHIDNNNLTQSAGTNVTTTAPEVSNADQLLKNVDKYRKIYSHSFYQRDKSNPDVVEDVSQVTSDFLLHFLPLIVPHALPRSVNLMSLSNGSHNETYGRNSEAYENLLKSSHIGDKTITVSSINTNTSLPYTNYELNNNMNHPKVSNTIDDHDSTRELENIMRDRTTTTDGFKITFLRKDLSEDLMSFSTPNMTIVKVTPIITNLQELKNWSYSNSDEMKYNVTSATFKPSVEEEVNVNVNVGEQKDNGSFFFSKKHNMNETNFAVTKIIERQSKNLNMFNNNISTTSGVRLIKGKTLKTKGLHTNWLDDKIIENKTLRKLGRRHFYETAEKPVITISYINTTTISNYLFATKTEIYPIL